MRVGALCNDAVLETDENGQLTAIGDPTEGALVLAADQLGFDMDELQAEWPRVAEVPFTSERKRMTTVHKMSTAVQASDVPWRGAPYVVITKGAVDSLLEITSQVLVENEFVPLDDELHRTYRKSQCRLCRSGTACLGGYFPDLGFARVAG